MTRKTDGGKARKDQSRIRGVRRSPGTFSKAKIAKAPAFVPSGTRENYDEARAELDRLIDEVVGLSVTMGGTPSPTRRQYWSSVLLAKMTLTCMTLNTLVPRIASPESTEIWDLGSIATLIRGLAENYFLLHWLCVETDDPGLWALRFALLQIVDNRARYRLLDEVEGEAEPEELVTAQQSYAKHLVTMELWNQIDPKRQKELLKGKGLPFIQDEVVEKLDLDQLSFRRLYRYLSSFVHTGTISFFRADSQGRGNGEYNGYEADAIIVCMAFTNLLLGTLVADMRAIHFSPE